MSDHVLLNLLNELGKSDKMRGLPSILSLFRNKLNKFNNTVEHEFKILFITWHLNFLKIKRQDFAIFTLVL